MPFKAGAIFGEASLNSSKWMAGLSGMQKATALTMGAITAVMVAATAKTAKAANEFTKELKNVSTLLDETVISTKDVQKALLGIDSTLGSTTELTKGMYQAFSAGAETLEEAMDITTTSAKFAKAGLTDINTSVDVLTTAVNAYGKEIMTAEQASDIFFTTIKKGKITGEELASSIGNSIPLYASAGIALEELSAGIAAMTKQGVNAANATTQLNAIVNGFLKPSAEMIAQLQSMGFESGSAFLEAEGLAGALELIEEATEGDAQKISELLPNIRAMRGAMALTGVGGKEFTASLEAMKTAAGSTQEAFDKQEKTWETMQNSLKKLEINVGLVTKEFVDGLVVGITQVSEWFNNLGQGAKDFAGNFLIVGSAVGVVTLAVMGLNAAFVALAANPIVAAVAGITLLTTGVIALVKTLNDKAIREASPRFEEIAESIGVASDKVEDLAEASLSLDRYFEQLNKNAFGNMGDEAVGITSQIEEMAKRFDITETQVIAVALASEKISDSQRDVLESLQSQINANNQILASQRITKELNSAISIVEEKSLLRINAKEVAQKAINDAIKEEQDIKDAITKKAKELELIEQSRLEGVIEARKTALAEYDKALETASIRANLNITDSVGLLEESAVAAEAYRDALIAIGFDGANASSIGNIALTDTISLLTTQKAVLEDIALEELELAEANEDIQEDTEETIEEMTATWKDYFNIIKSGYAELTSSLFGLLTQLTTNEKAELDLALQNELEALQTQLDNKVVTQEEYDESVLALEKTNKDKLNKLNEKAFNADKANRVSQVAQSAASSIMGWWEVAPSLGPIAGPIFGGVMTGVIGGFAIANSAAIMDEKFVPAMAKGGTASGVTRVHEEGGEIFNLPDGTVVIPNDISRQIASNSGSQNVMNVSFAGANISDSMSLNKIVDQVSRRIGKQLRTV